MSRLPAKETIVQVSRDVCRGFRRGLVALLAYEILFKLLAAGVLAPFSAWVLGRFVAATGSVAVSNQQVLSFALSRWGVVTLLVTGALAFLITFLEQAGLMAIASAALSGQPGSARAALRRAAGRARDLLLLAGYKIGLYFACFVPFAAVAGAAYVAWLSEHDINFYLAKRPPAFWWAAGVGGVALAGLLVAWGVLYVRTMFALPACVLAQKRPGEALKSSFGWTRGTVLQNAAVLLLWLLAVSALGGVVGIVLRLIEGLAIHAAGQRLAVLIFTLAALVLLSLLAAATVSFVGVTTNALVVVSLYRLAAGADSELQSEPSAQGSASGGLPPWLTRKRAVLAGLLAFAAGTTVLTGVLIEQIGIEDDVAVTAHRGGSVAAPENTLSAVRTAIRQGADFAEIDVQETADGVIVVLHDTDLRRITGRSTRVWEATYDEIRTLDAGTWFSPEFAGEHIPTLQEVMDAARGRIRLNIELKFHGHERHFVERTVHIVQANHFHDQCVLTSLDHDGLLKAKALDGRLTVGHIVSVALGNLAALDVDFLSVFYEQVTPGFVQTLHHAGKEIHVWTVNDAEKMSALIDLGVDNLITDDPALARSVLQQRAEMNSAERLLLGVRHWLER